MRKGFIVWIFERHWLPSKFEDVQMKIYTRSKIQQLVIKIISIIVCLIFFRYAFYFAFIGIKVFANKFGYNSHVRDTGCCSSDLGSNVLWEDCWGCPISVVEGIGGQVYKCEGKLTLWVSFWGERGPKPLNKTKILCWSIQDGLHGIRLSFILIVLSLFGS